MKDINNKLLEYFEEYVKEITYRKGETIFKQSTNVTHLVYIKKGITKLFIEGENGKNIIIDFMRPGKWTGFSTITGFTFYPYTMTALTDCDVYYISKDLFDEEVFKKSEIAHELFKLQNEFSMHLFQKISDLGTKNMFGRLAATILYLNKKEFQDEKIYEHLTRRDIADFSGMSIESMVRILNELKNDKIIYQKNKLLTVNDEELLIRLAKLG